jgi:HPt (histidine-containing phosphotransfer) domain-containing protein
MPRPSDDATAAGIDPAVGRLAAAAVGLSLAAVAAPIAVTTLAAANRLLGPPLADGALVGLLILAPVGVGLATALCGLRHVAALAAQAGHEAEMAVLRVLVATLLFGYMLAVADGGAAASGVLVAAAALVAAWAFLLCLILWPVVPRLRCYAAMTLDITMLSVLLHVGGGAVAGWYPLYLVEIFYLGARFGRGVLVAATTGSVIGFAAVILTTGVWRRQPALASGLLVALAALPACFAATIRTLTAARHRAEADRPPTLRLIADTLRDLPAVERSTQGAMLDLGRRVVLLATEDDVLARTLAEPLAVWNAEPSWPGDIEAALVDLARSPVTPRPVVIIDGRARLLSALSLGLRAARLGGGAPFVLLIAEGAQIGSLGNIDEHGIGGFIPAPVSEESLATALAALPLAAAPPPPVAPLADPAEKAPAAQVTPIAAHPKFAAEGAAALDPRVIDRLRALGGGANFAGEVIGAFRSEAQRIMAGIDEAAVAGDTALFAQRLMALRRAAGHVGGIRLSELAASLQGVTAADLHQRGAEHIQLLNAEIVRLAATLAEVLPAVEARRR